VLGEREREREREKQTNFLLNKLLINFDNWMLQTASIQAG